MPTINPDHFKEVMRCWVAGVTVVTSRLGDQLHGCTANSFTSVSLTPPLVTVTLAKRLHTYQMIHQSRVFAVNILGEDQAETSTRFAGTSTRSGVHVPEGNERFEGEPYRAEVTGAPILERAIAFVDCRLVDEHHLGDNVILIGQVEEGRVQNSNAPLIYSNRQYWKLGLWMKRKE